jgi:hypothetical protein
MSNVLFSLANDYATLVTQNANLRPVAWSMTALKSVEHYNTFSRFEGPEGSGRPVLKKNDITKGVGQTINYTVVAAFGGEPRRGSQPQMGYEERSKEGTFQVTIDFVRHATATTKKFDLVNAVKLEGLRAAMLGQHLGWNQEWDIMMRMRNSATVNVIRPNYKSSREQLRSADVIMPSLIDTAKEQARTNGAIPFEVSKAKAGYPMKNFLFLAPHPALTSFEETPQYQQAIQYAAERGADNPVFSGEYPNWKGTIIYPHETVDGDWYGPIGSAFAPKAKLGNPIAAGTVAVTITGGATPAGAGLGQGGDTNQPPLYFKGFSNWDYQWMEGQTPLTFSAYRYALIFNMTASSAGGDAGKWGFYRFLTNGGNTLTTDVYQASDPNALLGAGGPSGGRLGPNANGGGADTSHNIVGNVTWNATANTQNHPSGSLIVETNSYGVAFGFSVVMGAECVARGYGKDPFLPTKSLVDDYGFLNTAGYESCYGQSVRLDTDGNPRGYSLVEHAIAYAGINLPTV